MTVKHVASMLGPGTNWHDLGRQLLEEPLRMAEGDTGFAGMDFADPYLAYDLGAYNAFVNAPPAPSAPPSPTAVNPVPQAAQTQPSAPSRTIFRLGNGLPPEILNDLIGQGFQWDAATGELMAPAGYRGSLEDFIGGLNAAAARSGWQPPQSEAATTMDAMEQLEVAKQEQYTPLTPAQPTAADLFRDQISQRISQPIAEWIPDVRNIEAPAPAELQAWAVAHPEPPEWLRDLQLQRVQTNAMNLAEQMLVSEQTGGQQGFEIDRQAPAPSLRNIAMQTGAQPGLAGAVTQHVAPVVADVMETVKNAPVFFNPLDPVERRGGGNAMTVGEIYKYLDMPAETGARIAEEKIGGAPGRIVGEAIRFGLAPETVAGIALGGTGVLANILGRGDITVAQYLAMSAVAGAAYQGAEEVGAPEGLKMAAALLGGVGSIAALPADSRFIARQLLHVPETMSDDAFEVMVRSTLKLPDDVTGKALDEAVAQAMPNLPATAQRQSILDVPAFSPEAAQLVSTAGRTYIPAGVSTRMVEKSPAPFGIALRGGASTFEDLPAGDFDSPIAQRGAIPKAMTPTEQRFDDAIESFRGEDGFLHADPEQIVKLFEDATGNKYPSTSGGPILSLDDMRYALEKGIANGEWYYRWGTMVDELANTWGMDQDFVRTLFAVTSQQTPPLLNLVKTLNALAEINRITDAGMKELDEAELMRAISAGAAPKEGYGAIGNVTADQVKKIASAWKTGRAEVPTSIKTPSFFGNLWAGARGLYSPWITGDTMHGKFFGFGESGGGNFAGAAQPGAAAKGASLLETRLGQYMAAELGIAPDVGQASMWASMKGVVDNDVSDEMAQRFNLRKIREKVTDEDGRTVLDENDNIVYRERYDQTYADLVRDGKITFKEAVDDSFVHHGNDLAEALQDPRVHAALAELQRSADEVGVAVPPSWESDLVHLSKAKTDKAAAFGLEVSPQRAAELTADVESRSPVVFAATRPGSAEGSLDFWREQHERALRYLDYNPETQTFSDLARIRLPHRVEVGGAGAWGNSAEPNIRIYLPGGNIDTARWVSAHLGQKMDAFGDLMHQEGFGIEVPGGPARFRALEFDAADMDDAYFGRAMEAAALEDIGLQTKTGSPGTLQFVDYDGENPANFEAAVKRVVAALQGDETGIRPVNVSSELVEAGEGSSGYAEILSNLDARFDPNGTARGSRSHAESLRALFAKEEAASRKRYGAGAGEAPGLRGDVPEEIPDVAGGGFGPDVGGGAFGSPDGWSSNPRRGPRLDKNRVEPTAKFGVGDRGWIAPDGQPFRANGEWNDHLELLEPDSFNQTQEFFRNGWARVGYEKGRSGREEFFAEYDPGAGENVRNLLQRSLPGHDWSETQVVLDGKGDPGFRFQGTASAWRSAGFPVQAADYGDPWAPDRPIGGGAFGDGPQGQVLRVAVKQGATAPVEEQSLAAARGAVRITDPNGVRILGPGEEPGPDETLFFHGTAGLEGDSLKAEAWLAPIEADAQSYARASARLGRLPPIGGGAFGRGRTAAAAPSAPLPPAPVLPPPSPAHIPGSPNLNPNATFNANPPAQAASPPVPPAGSPPGGGASASAAATPPPQHALGAAPRGTSGSQQMIKLADAAVEGGLQPGQARNVFTRAIGTVLPSKDMPRKVTVGLNARNGSLAANYQYYGQRQVDAAKAVQQAWDNAVPTRVRDTGRPEGLVDYLLAPTAYTNAAPELTQAKNAYGRVMLEDLDHARSQFDVDIDAWHPTDPDGVYVPKMRTEQALKDKSIGGSGNTRLGKVGIQKDRASEIIDVLDDTIETDLLVLSDRHAQQLATATGNSTFRQVMGGLTKDEVFDTLAAQGLPQYKRLRDLKDSVHNNVVNLRKARDNYRQQAAMSNLTVQKRGKQVDEIEERMAGIQARVDEIMQQDDPYGPGLSHYSGQLYELARDLRLARAVEQRQGRRAANMGMRSAAYERLLNKAIDEFHELSLAARNLDPPGYVLEPNTRRYMPVDDAKAMHGVFADSFGHAFADGVLNFLEEARIVQLGAGDLSPLTVNQGFLGMASSPWTAAKMLVDHPARLVSQAFAGDDVLWRGVNQDHLRTYQALQGYSVMRGGGAPELRQAGRGLEHLANVQKGGKLTAPVRGVGRTVRKSNEVASRLTEYGRFKAWEDWTDIIRKMNPNMPIEQVQAGALKALNEAVPALNLTQSGYGGLRGRLARAPLTSLSFALSPAVMAKDMTAAMVQMGKATATGNGPIAAWQSLLPRQQAALLMGTSLMSTLGVISAGSAAAFGDQESSMGKRMLQAIQPIDFDKEGKLKFNGDFFKFTVPGGGTVPIGGPFRSAFSLAVNSALRPAVAAANQVPGVNLAVSDSSNPLAPLDFMENRLAGPLGTFWHLAWNNDWKNDKIREGDFLDQVQQSLLYGLENVNLVTGVPFEALRTGERQGLKEMGTDLGASFAGLNWMPPEPTYIAQMDTISQELYGRNYHELWPNEKRDIRDDPRYKEATKDFEPSPLSDVYSREEANWQAVSEDGAKWMEARKVRLADGREVPLLPAHEVDRLLASGEISGADARAYYKAAREALRETSAYLRDNDAVQAELADLDKKRKSSKEELTYQQQATADYYSIFDKPGLTNKDGTFNYDLFEEEVAKFEKKYGEGVVEKISPSAIPLSSGEQRYRDDSAFIAETGWFDAYDKGFELAKQSKTYGPQLAEFKTHADFVAEVTKEGKLAGYSQQQIEDAIFELETKFGITKAVNVIQADTLRTGGDPLVEALQRWGYALNAGELRMLKQLLQP